MKSKVFVRLIISTIVLLSILQIIVSNSLSTTGLELGKIEEELSVYKRENALLRQEYLTVTSFTYIAEKAQEIGLTEEKTDMVLDSSLPLAIKQ